jgi:peroxiredoxin
MNNLSQLPNNLPVPIDDGLCDHLLRKTIPSISLSSTEGIGIDLSSISGYLVIYCYPMTGQPDIPLPDKWDSIPGARGCTPQACDFRDHYQDLQLLNTKVFGISTQSTEYQLEVKQRLHLPFHLLSDHEFLWSKSLNLPILEVDNKRLIKRLTLIVRDQIIVKVFYPVFPPHENANQVINWLSTIEH